MELTPEARGPGIVTPARGRSCEVQPMKPKTWQEILTPEAREALLRLAAQVKRPKGK